MFDRPHHRRIASVLEQVDAQRMREHRSLFGGGTALALSLGEYRESVDIDFICDSVDGYRKLRSEVVERGIQALFSAPLALAREVRLDQCGIRCAFLVDGHPVKFEIIYEGRISLSDPNPSERICKVWTLATEDRVATKLMANSDRWADDSVMGRDIIDLAMLTETGALSAMGVAKAVRAYGNSVIKDLEKAKAHLLEREGKLKQFMRKMDMRMPIETLRERVARLRAG